MSTIRDRVIRLYAPGDAGAGGRMATTYAFQRETLGAVQITSAAEQLVATQGEQVSKAVITLGDTEVIPDRALVQLRVAGVVREFRVLGLPRELPAQQSIQCTAIWTAKDQYTLTGAPADPIP